MYLQEKLESYWDENVKELDRLISDFTHLDESVIKNVVKEYGNNYGALALIGERQASDFGISNRQLDCMKDIFRVSNLLYKQVHRLKLKVNNPSSIYQYYADMKLLEHEVVVVCALDTKYNVIQEKVISVGALNGAIFDVREIARFALMQNANAIYALHNHPSGDPEPSPQDLQVTKALKEGLESLHINLIDHIIVGDNRYCSFKELGYL